MTPQYTASIKILGKIYKGEGKSAMEAIENIKAPRVAKGVSVLEITHGKVSKSRFLTVPQTFRLFSPSPLMREVALKNTSLMFAGI